VALVACSLPLVPGLRQAWSLQLVAIDLDPRTVLSPAIAHDLELSRDGLKLAGGRV